MQLLCGTNPLEDKGADEQLSSRIWDCTVRSDCTTGVMNSYSALASHHSGDVLLSLKTYVAFLIENPSSDPPPRRYVSHEGGECLIAGDYNFVSWTDRACSLVTQVGTTGLISWAEIDWRSYKVRLNLTTSLYSDLHRLHVTLVRVCSKEIHPPQNFAIPSKIWKRALRTLRLLHST